MKWGVRRYQNEDGTMTELGKKRYYKEADRAGYGQQSGTGARYKTVGEGKKRRDERFNADPDQWVEKDRQNTKRVVDEASQMTGRLKNLNNATTPEPKKIKMDLSNMSDKQMRDEINRALLERQYNDMFAPQKTNKGREYLNKTLDIAGGVLGVTSSAIGIAVAIKQLKEGK
jgi:hypothetical protein